MLLLVVVSAVVPDTANEEGWLLVQQMILIGYKDAGGLSEGSRYPLVIMVSFSMAIILSWVAAIVMSLTRVHMHAFQVVESKSYLVRVLTVGFMLVLMLLPLFKAMPVSELHFSYHVFKAMTGSRLLITGFSVGYFLLSLTFWVWILFELSNLLGLRSSTSK
ncbi:hypothetical protein [Pseudomonas sp. BIC9C]|uniref:hypothetical protein n=1 Tax=Pseudomonas sp. BIC9C TaxID=3078458 RepID=UPI002AD4EF11|nr:hypothetical protein [Pseudomonas sp. BIC9C]